MLEIGKTVRVPITDVDRTQGFLRVLLAVFISYEDDMYKLYKAILIWVLFNF